MESCLAALCRRAAATRDNQHHIIARYSGEMINIISTIHYSANFLQIDSLHPSLHCLDDQLMQTLRPQTAARLGHLHSHQQELHTAQCGAGRGNLFRFNDLHTALHSFLDTRQDDATQHNLAWVSGN